MKTEKEQFIEFLDEILSLSNVKIYINSHNHNTKNHYVLTEYKLENDDVLLLNGGIKFNQGYKMLVDLGFYFEIVTKFNGIVVDKKVLKKMLNIEHNLMIEMFIK